MPCLTDEQLTHFDEEGYLLVRGMLDVDKVIQPIIDEYHGVLDNLARELYQAGQIASTYDDLPFGKRLTQIVVESGQIHAQYFDFSLPQTGIEADTPFWAGPAVFRCITDPTLLDVAESIVGPEIWSNPVQHVRLKPPERLVPKDHNGQALVSATNWHQDSGVVLPEADASKVLTVWFPLNEATLENGCLQIMPQSHRSGLHTHCPGHPSGLRIPRAIYGYGIGYAGADAARRRAPPHPPHHPRLAVQPQRRRALELRPALQSRRPNHRSRYLPRLCRPQ
jgi:phytanoyl-CoA hydroxylase